MKLSNFYYEKIMIQKACQCAFSLLVLSLQLKASYMRYKFANMPGLDQDERDQYTSKVKNLLLFSNILSLFQCYNAFIVELLKIEWLKSKM